MPDEIKMDRDVFKALASDTRVNILKSLDERQKTVTELSKELDMAKSSSHEHLARLVDSGLVEKLKDEHRWTYYSLTFKGREILHPHEKTKVLFLLGSSIVLLLGGVVKLLGFRTDSVGKMTQKEAMITSEESLKAVEEAGRTSVFSTPEPVFGVLLFTLGIFLGILAYLKWEGWDFPGYIREILKMN